MPRVLAGMTFRQRLYLTVIAVVTATTAVLEYSHQADLAIFIAAGVTLAGLAWLISFATEALGERFSPAVTGVMQSTLGNLPELFVVLFALKAGEVTVAQTSILGSLFANALLVLGFVLVAGATKAPDGIMRFHKRLPNDTATLLLLASFIIVILDLSESVSDRASQHQIEISVIGAICLLLLYGFWLWGYLRMPHEPDATGAKPAEHKVSLTASIAMLAVAGVAAAFVSEWFIGSLDTAVDKLGISKAFTGLVIVAIAGNAVENVVGVALAAKGKADLAISVVKNSVAQIAVFLFPMLVLLSLPFENRLTFVLAPVFAGALVLTALAVWQITGDGEATAFEGWALVLLFVVLAALAWYE
jgi:Ca2+:H+ antiporter